MKKIFFTSLFLLPFLFTNAQELLSKKGTPILPETGDWSIGFDATPLLNYVGNFFNHSENNHMAMGYQDSVTLVGLYIKNPTTAYRAKVRLSFLSQKWTSHVPDQFNANSLVNDERNFSQFGITVGGGIQKMRGKGRLRGIYGVEGLLGFLTSKNTYSYGNTIDVNNQTPVSTDWSDAFHKDVNNPSPDNVDSLNGTLVRYTTVDNGSGFMISIRGFIGAEYFFAPKISLSAEYGWSIGFVNYSEGEVDAEFWNSTSAAKTTQNIPTGKKLSFGTDVDNSGGSIVLHVYF
jgi:hypothetical protein